MKSNNIKVLNKKMEDWNVTLVDTGQNTMTGGRLKRVKEYLKDTFCLTYGDGVADVDLKKLIEFHKSHQKIATLTSVQPPGRWGSLKIKDQMIEEFKEKPDGDGAWVNGGFFVLEPEVINLISGDNCIFEKETLQELAKMSELMTYRHKGFWKAMDTLRDKESLEKLWKDGNPPWKSWLG